MPDWGQSGYTLSGNVKIWYSDIRPDVEERGVVLLLHGLEQNALSWPEYFYRPLLDSGYRVVRIDLRDAGNSIWTGAGPDDWPYTIEDMAEDAVAALDHLMIEKVHLLGQSIGGLIAIQIATAHPQRTRSLITLMTPAKVNDPPREPLSQKTLKSIIKLRLRYLCLPTEKNQIKYQVALKYVLMGDHEYNPNVALIARQYSYLNENRQGINKMALKRHLTCIQNFQARYDMINDSGLPTLIVHGNSDPLLDFSHAIKLSQEIKNSELLLMAGMGHDVNSVFASTILRSIFKILRGNSG